MSSKRENIYFATWLRVLGVLLILLCHFTQQSGNTYLIMSSQFFNIGNEIFFIMSGFLFGISGSKRFTQVLPWYKKRFTRIYLPYELMIVTLFALHIMLGYRLDPAQWIKQFLGVQGWDGVYGATQTWFVTSILLCYVFTPIISITTNEICTERKGLTKAVLFWSILPAVMAYTFGGIVDISIFIPICWYALAFILGANFDRVPIKRVYAIYAFVIMCVGFGVRLIGRSLCDGTILYNQIIAGYTHAIGALCIFYIFAVVFRDIKPVKPIVWFANISYEIYLWHYMFTDGPLRIFGITNYWVLDCLVVFVITVLVALFANKISDLIIKRIGERKA